VTITTISDPASGVANALAPSYAVVDGMGIMASNPDELKLIIDTHKNRVGIEQDPAYQAASRASLTSPSSVFYVAIAKLLDGLQSAPRHTPAADLGFVGDANLKPLRALMVTSTSSQDGIIDRVILFID
jgi:hypothetical protein